jgi:hypothetical protein
VGEEALIRFYLLHVMILPLLLVILMAVHFWRIRKDGGLTRPEDVDDRLGPPPPDTYPVFTEAPTKTYHLAAIVRGRTAAVGQGPENTVPSMPHLFYAELGVLMVTVFICVALAMVVRRSAEGTGQSRRTGESGQGPLVFPGLAGVGFILGVHGRGRHPDDRGDRAGLDPVPGPRAAGDGRVVWRAGRHALVLQSAVVGLALVIGLEAFAIRSAGCASGIRRFPQWVITAVNPGTILASLYALYSLWLIRRYNSARAGALGLFTCFLCGFVVLTIIGSYFRGPNWDFYWSPAHWPQH